MELSLLLAAGAAAGLAASLPLRLMWQHLAVPEAKATLANTLWSEWQYVVLHAAWGAALGLLFWLSWGFAALVGIPWWLRGVFYGGMFGVLVLPMLFMARLLARWPWMLLAALLLDAVSTSALTGLICAWNWTHAP